MPATSILLDTDMLTDCDDDAALALAFQLERRGDCRLLGITVSSAYPASCAVVSAIADFSAFLDGARTLAALRPGDTVAIAEACTHRPEEEDIGTVKIPRLLQKKVGGELRFLRGHDLPPDLDGVRVVIYCGACVWNRRAMLQRISECQSRGIPITNYGMAIAWCLGILERAIQPLL